MNNNSNVTQNKARAFALRIIKLYRYLNDQKKEFVLSKQVLRSGTSIGANITEGHFAQSKADFIAKYSIALKEAAETFYWLDLLCASDFISADQASSLMNDCKELIALLTSSLKTARASREQPAP